MPDRKPETQLPCEEARALLALRPVDALEPEEARELEEHLVACPACARESARVSEAVGLVAKLGPARRPLPAHLWERLERELDVPAPDELAAARVASAIRVALDCCYCKGAIARGQAAYCASCLAPHHEECFRAHRRCSTYGCDETRLVRPQDASTPAPQAPIAPAQPGRVRRIASPLLIAAVGGLTSAAAVVAVTNRGRSPEVPPLAQLEIPHTEASPAPSMSRAMADVLAGRTPSPTPTAGPPFVGPPKVYPRHVAPELKGTVFPGKVALEWRMSSEDQFLRVVSLQLLRREVGRTDWEKVAALAPDSTSFDDPSTPEKPREYRIVETAITDRDDPVIERDKTELDPADGVKTADWKTPEKPDQVWHEQGMAALGKGDLRKASDCLGNAIGVNPRSVEHWLARARVRRLYVSERSADKQSPIVPDYTPALADCDAAIQLAPRSPGPWIERSLTELAAKDLDAAERDAGEAILAAKDDDRGYATRARVREARGDLKGALEDLDRVVALDPAYAGNWKQRALLRGKLDDSKGEIADLTKFLEKVPSDAEALTARVEARGNVGDFEGALKDATQLIELDRTAVEPRRLRARIEVAKQDYLGAINDCTAILARGPDAEALLLRAGASLKRGDVDGAALDASSLLAGKHTNSEQDFQAHRIRGLARARKGYTRGAVEDLELVAKESPAEEPELDDILAALDAIAPPTTASLVARATARINQGDPARALVAAESALKLDGKLVGALIVRGEARLVKHELPAALADAQQAVKLEATSADAWVLLGLVLGAQGDAAGELAALEKAAREDPHSQRAVALLADAYLTRRKLGEALQCANQMLANAGEKDPAGREERARVLIAMGRWVDALRDLERTLNGGGSPNVATWRELLLGLAKEGPLGDAVTALNSYAECCRRRWSQDPEHEKTVHLVEEELRKRDGGNR